MSETETAVSARLDKLNSRSTSEKNTPRLRCAFFFLGKAAATIRSAKSLLGCSYPRV